MNRVVDNGRPTQKSGGRAAYGFDRGNEKDVQCRLTRLPPLASHRVWTISARSDEQVSIFCLFFFLKKKLI